MAEVVKLIDPHKLKRNRENPRLIFRPEELEALQNSIAEQGILVPLTIFQDGKGYTLLDGERRWRCAIKLGLSKVPVIIQPRPDRMQNIMMMFAIHNARKDWLPLPTAFKLKELEEEYFHRNGKLPTEIELAGIASLARGVVRRLKKLLALPKDLQDLLVKELEKPQSKQDITVDQVLEATKAAESLRKALVIDESIESKLRKALIIKFKSGVIKNTVEPRKLAKVARAVRRGEVTVPVASKVIERLIADSDFSIEDAFSDTVEETDFQHNIQQLIERVIIKLDEHKSRKYKLSTELEQSLCSLLNKLQGLL